MFHGVPHLGRWHRQIYVNYFTNRKVRLLLVEADNQRCALYVSHQLHLINQVYDKNVCKVWTFSKRNIKNSKEIVKKW